jgi:hypothetical protein
MILALILACAPVPTDAGPIGSTSADPVAGGLVPYRAEAFGWPEAT